METFVYPGVCPSVAGPVALRWFVGGLAWGYVEMGGVLEGFIKCGGSSIGTICPNQTEKECQQPAHGGHSKIPECEKAERALFRMLMGVTIEWLLFTCCVATFTLP